MQVIPFPLGLLRPSDIFRTIRPNGEVVVQKATESQFTHPLEAALEQYEPGCIQEIWDLSGEGILLARKGTGLPSLHIGRDDTGVRFFDLFYPSTGEKNRLEFNQGNKIFEKILIRNTHLLVSISQYDRIMESREHEERDGTKNG